MMKIQEISIFSFVAYLFAIINFVGCTGDKEVREFISDFESLSIGDTEAKTISVLGNLIQKNQYLG